MNHLQQYMRIYFSTIFIYNLYELFNQIYILYNILMIADIIYDVFNE